MPITARFAAASARAYGMFRTMVSVAVDPFFQYVTALLHGDGTNGAQNNTFLDSSSNAYTVTRNGNPTQGSYSPFSQKGWSAYFDGTTDYINFTNQATTSSFTCECWFYCTANATNGYHILFGGSTAAGALNSQLYVTNGGGIGVALSGSSIIAATGTAAAQNQWNHIAFVRSGTSIAVFVNGNRIATGTSSAALNVDRIGNNNFPGYEPIGYISNARINTTAVYDPSLTTCTVPTTPLTAITGTYLLTLQSNRFVDNSASPLTLTVNGNTSIQPISPFYATTAYSTASVGGSAYLDGAGDYLSIPDAAPMELGSGNWTIEFWANTTNTTAYSAAFSRDAGGVVAGSYVIFVNGATADGVVSFWSADINGFSTSVLTSGTTSCRDGGWHHIAVVRNSNTLTMYIDGVSKSTATFSGAFGDTAQPIWLGAENGYSRPYTGYLSDVRLVIGTAVYTSNFTVPTAPLTAISGTQLLLNFTNAGIYDNAANVDYETVGDAQVSTSIKKYGTGSMKFDGTGDYLPSTTSPSFSLGTGDFTIEGWVYFTNTANKGIFQVSPTAGGLNPSVVNTVCLAYYNNASYGWILYANGALNAWLPPVDPGNTWVHFAVSRAASITKLFINGNNVLSVSDATNYTTTNLVLGGYYSTAYLLPGYIDDFRFTRGVGRYLYSFMPPTEAYPNIGGSLSLSADPYFNYTTLLLPGNGTNGAQNNTFVDSSTNALTITRNGNSTQGSASPYSQTGWGNYFNGTTDYLTVNAQTALSLGTSDFTVEAWVYPTAVPGTYWPVIDCRSAATASPWAFGMRPISGSLKIEFYDGIQIDGVTAIPLNQWTHIAFSRSGTTLRGYVNGVLDITTSNSTNMAASGTTQRIAALVDPFYGSGYISNFRVTKGGALYTSNFTPPTTALTTTVSAGTVSLLTCQSNRFVDNSANAFALTLAGTPNIQAVSPFAPLAAYSTSTIGGAAYFDGTGDYLSVTSNAVLNLGSNNFTIEAWYYAAGGSTEYIVSKGTTGGTNSEFYLGVNSARYVQFAYSVTGSSNTVISTSPNAITANAWNHIAVTRSGSTYYVFINGAVAATGSITATIRAATGAMQIGALNSGSLITGYLSDLRIVNGTAVYTAAFTPPTSALTAITNTAFLLSATNAGIYDATAKNICETLGNAQISTTQSKFGGSSMYFDGTGDYLTFKRTQPLFFGTGDYTIEFWFYNSAAQKTPSALFAFHTGATTYFAVYNNTATYPNVLNVDDGSGTAPIVGTTTLATGQWYHCAVSRYNGNTRLFLNGFQEGSTWATTTAPSSSATSFRIASAGSVTQTFTGYIDDFRITTGVARYTSNFTPPTSALLLQ